MSNYNIHNMRQTRVWSINILMIMTFLGVWLPAHAARAATEPPEKNPLCWSKEACTEQYKSAGWCDDKTTPCEGKVSWLAGEPAGCGAWGACVPPGKAQLSIAFNGKTEVKDLGEYIKLIYAFLVGAAGVIAAVLIVKGGFEYIIAGGASERVIAAKKTIGSAVFGLLLVLASYTLLNTINPDLVHLRLPNVYMVRKIALGADWCKDANLGKDNSGKEKQFAALKEGQEYSNATWNVSKDSLTCGAQYLIPDGDGKACMGDVCKPGMGECEVNKTACTCYVIPGNKKVAKCINSNISGNISLDNPDKYVDNLHVAALCENYTTFALATKNTGKNTVGYRFSIDLEKAKNFCKDKKGLAGLVLFVEVNDDTFSNYAPTNDDTWVIGKKFCASSCPAMGVNSEMSIQDIFEVDNFPGMKTGLFDMRNKFDFWTINEFEKGVNCDLKISSQNMPNLGGKNNLMDKGHTNGACKI